MTGGLRLGHDWYPEKLPPGVSIGERSWLYSSFAFLHCRSTRSRPVRIGQDSGVYVTTFFDLGPEGEVVIGDFCAVVGAIFATNHRVEVGDYALIAHDVTIADHEFVAPHRRMTTPDRGDEATSAARRQAGGAGDILIGPNVWVGAHAVVLAGASIGEDAVVGAGAVVTGTVPAGAVVAGNPAEVVRRRRGRLQPPRTEGTLPATATRSPTML
ncbi:MAG: hypothetical protein NVS3B26_20270 [Mycobacteriales bacterium]